MMIWLADAVFMLGGGGIGSLLTFGWCLSRMDWKREPHIDVAEALLPPANLKRTPDGKYTRVPK